MSQVYLVAGMTCKGCAHSVEVAIKFQSPDAEVSVDLGSAQVTVEGATEDQVKQAIQEVGFSFIGPA
jgi:copper chaperone